MHHNSTGLHLSQEQYALDILDRHGDVKLQVGLYAHRHQCKIILYRWCPFHDPHYRSLAGALQYLTLGRPDISPVV